jgi:hypothetical protein
VLRPGDAGSSELVCRAGVAGTFEPARIPDALDNVAVATALAAQGFDRWTHHAGPVMLLAAVAEGEAHSETAAGPHL